MNKDMKGKKIIEVIEGFVVPHKVIAHIDNVFGYPAWGISFLYLKEVGQNSRKVRITIEDI